MEYTYIVLEHTIKMNGAFNKYKYKCEAYRVFLTSSLPIEMIFFQFHLLNLYLC